MINTRAPDGANKIRPAMTKTEKQLSWNQNASRQPQESLEANLEEIVQGVHPVFLRFGVNDWNAKAWHKILS